MGTNITFVSNTHQYMQNILVAGAGKSSTFLIHYLLTHAQRNKWNIIVADGNADAIAAKIGNHPNAKAAPLDITDDTERRKLVQDADLVISLMPPNLHIHLAKDCLQYKKNLITSSYVSPELREMNAAVKEAGLMFMCEMGLDPGIDHMTANQIIHSIQRVAAQVTCFKSYCGGLIAPESDDNPWHYKFSWNPRNIITAGMDGAQYLVNGKQATVSYGEMFEQNKKIRVEGLGSLAYYPNRDSLRYLDLYDLPDARTFLRATLRHPDFIKGWNALVELGLTDLTDHFDTSGLTYAGWVKQKSHFNGSSISLAEHVAQKLDIEPGNKVINMIHWLGLFEDRPLPAKRASSGDILLDLLLDKWEMKSGDKDMVVMQHEVEYLHRGRKIKMCSTMVLKGEDREFSAMAKTVGLPMGILARMVMKGKITPPTGVVIPNMPGVYRPVLTELQHYGIVFKEEIL